MKCAPPAKGPNRLPDVQKRVQTRIVNAPFLPGRATGDVWWKCPQNDAHRRKFTVRRPRCPCGALMEPADEPTGSNSDQAQ